MRKLLLSISLVGALMGVGATAVRAGQERPSHPAWSHVVRPGETLWDLARRAAPARDPRQVVDLLIEANRLPGPTIHPGQRLVMPR